MLALGEFDPVSRSLKMTNNKSLMDWKNEP